MLPEFPVAVLAGGQATRLRPLTETTPKLLLEVAGEPFFTHQLRLLRQAGLTRVVACVGHLGRMIADQYGDGAAHGVHLEYSFDGPRLLGTGGALLHALPLLGDTFYVLYGDSYLPIDYPAVGRAFRACRQPALMTIYENQGRHDTSNVWFADGRIQAYDKQQPRAEMRHIDYGLGVLTATALAGRPRDRPFDRAEVYQQLAAEGRLAGYEVRQRFYEIGSREGLRELDELLRRTRH